MFNSIKILVVDDHDLVRTGLARILSEEPGFEVVSQADSGEKAIVLARRLEPDIVLMDIKMPGIGGVEATRRLTAAHDNLRVIVVTSCQDELHPRRLLQAGASAYLTKRAQPVEVFKAVRKVMAGQSYVSQEIAQRLALQKMDENSESSSPFKRLSERELQIASMVVQGEKVNEIAQKLNLTSKTINTFRYRIFQKFNVKNDVSLTLHAIRHKFLDLDALE